MSEPITRRAFQLSLGAGVVFAGATRADQPAAEKPAAGPRPTEAPFERDYAVPKFKPSWKRPQINRQMVQDFVIYGHSELDMVKKLLQKEPALLNASIDWGAGDWETALGGASHLGRRDIAEFLIERGARADLFTAAMLGQLDVVKTLLTFQPKLIDAKGPHGLTLLHHCKVGGKPAEAVLQYVQALKPPEPAPRKN
jgi:hypothetical protein